MKYIIAKESAIKSQGWKPVTGRSRGGYVVINENELRYRYHDITLDEAARLVEGWVVSSITALDFVSGRKDLTTILNELNDE